MTTDTWSIADREFMAQALKLAARGLYSTDPNPRVGCVMVERGQVVGTGWHRQAGTPHAEVHALREAGARARGATAYVTLEPCSHTGRTPPCAEALIAAGVARVVAAMQDPNPLVAGRGLSRLREAGLRVSCGLLQDEAKALNPGFIQRINQGRPLVRIKLAASVDGRTAMASGASKWITGPEARADVQRLRARSSAVLSGIGTVLADDPQLTVRAPDLCPEGLSLRQPLRVLLDRTGRLPVDSALVRADGPLWWVTGNDVVCPVTLSARPAFRHLCLLATDDRMLALLMQALVQAECNEVLVEAGATLAGAFMRAGLCDELIVYLAPKLLGSRARPMVDVALDQMSEAIDLSLVDIRQIGSDIRLRYRPR
jgi:diaminohydroxyphosphoribosylaminopyrimidine deaminase/5-amino-6-(5-phosphoribosylamino)uracil reductase